VGHVARIRATRNSFKSLDVNPERERLLRRPRRRWEDSIKIDLGYMGFGGVDWIHLAQDSDRWRARVNTVMKLQVP
jgi:hypothetical protein